MNFEFFTQWNVYDIYIEEREKGDRENRYAVWNNLSIIENFLTAKEAHQLANCLLWEKVYLSGMVLVVKR